MYTNINILNNYRTLTSLTEEKSRRYQTKNMVSITSSSSTSSTATRTIPNHNTNKNKKKNNKAILTNTNTDSLCLDTVNANYISKLWYRIEMHTGFGMFNTYEKIISTSFVICCLLLLLSIILIFCIGIYDGLLY